MALPHNRRAVLEVKARLEKLIVAPRLWVAGERPCVCERSHGHGAGRAQAIRPGGGAKPGLEAEYWSWQVLMEPTHAGDKPFTAALHQFIKVPVLEALFRQHFPRGRESNPYTTGIDQKQRYELGLPAAVCISRAPTGITFDCDWGREQAAGKSIFHLLTGAGMVVRSDERFGRAHAFLRQLLPDVHVYIGGPEPHPDHPWEVEWMIDFEAALEATAEQSYAYLFNHGRSSCGRREWYTGGTLYFGQ